MQGSRMYDPVVTRAARSGDISAVARLVGDYWQFEGIDGFETQTVARLLSEVLVSSTLGSIVVAEHVGTVVGYLLVAYVFSLEHRGLTAEIDELYVPQQFRGSGIGTRLLAFAETVSIDRGCTVAALRLSRSNEVGRKFYAQAGYTPRDEFGLIEKRLARP